MLYTCNKFFEKLPECNHSASHRGPWLCYWSDATAGNRAAERQFDEDYVTMSPSLAATTHTLTILVIHIAHLAYIKAMLIPPTDDPQ